MSGSNYFEQLGGEARLQEIIGAFVDAVVDDVMIGFFFRNVDRQRLKRLEYEFAAQHLGATVKYSGRPISQAHASHRIMGGQFMRRMQILREILERFEVPEAVREHWILHNEKLRPAITSDEPGECDDSAVSGTRGE